MALVVPCIRGRMGDNEFYEAKMMARELVTGVRPASELDEWSSMSIEERMQRDPNVKRIMKEIAPYLARTSDRFFGSVIVLVYKGEVFFEPLSKLGANIPRAYQSAAKDIGFVTIDGGSLIVLDGQHRLLALEKVIKGEIPGPFAETVGTDDICVIFIDHKSNERTRRMFNVVNRYAKSTSRGDNIITSEDDAKAIVTRRLLEEDGPLSPKHEANDEGLVVWKHNTLAARSTALTTISVVYQSVEAILAAHRVTFNDQLRPSDEELDEYLALAEKYWSEILKLSFYHASVNDVSKIPEMRQDSSPFSLLFKPAGQIAFIHGLLAAEAKGIELPELVRRAEHVDWCMTSDLWRDIIVRSNGTIDAKESAREKASMLIQYLLASDKMSGAEISKVQEQFSKARGHEDTLEQLPAPVVTVNS